ncbi:DUF2089 domain-containing protein [bacterium]|nr:DUF2089 domain-containing protein [bacterium]
MKTMDSNLQCPGCQQGLKPKLLACDNCGIKVEGPFQLNEFATLSGEDLHFLRIFLRCEGRIRDMEAALGLSYPTVRARLTDLKNRLTGESEPALTAPAKAPDTAEILKGLQSGKLSFEDAIRDLKKTRNQKE